VKLGGQQESTLKRQVDALHTAGLYLKENLAWPVLGQNFNDILGQLKIVVHTPLPLPFHILHTQHTSIA
jgi:hypothetical protein